MLCLTEFPPRTVREVTRRAAWLAAFVAVAITLSGFAHWQFTRQSDFLARQRIVAGAHAQPIMRWSLTEAEDIIAGRVFGDSQTRFDHTGLHITSHGEEVEFGARLDGPLDLERFGLATLAVDADSAAGFTWSATFPSSPIPCRSERFGVTSGQIVSRLDHLAWQCVLPSRPVATSLRLVLDAPRGASVTLRDFALAPASALQVPAADSMPRIATGNDVPSAVDNLNALAPSSLPVAIASAGWRDAATMQLREELHAATPAAVAISNADVASAASPLPSLAFKATWLPFASLLLAWIWPPRSTRGRTLVLVGAALLMPLWFGAGLRMGTPFSFLDQLFVIVGVVFLGWLILQPTKSWHWFGAPAAWLIPASSVMLTLGLALLIPRDTGLAVPDSVTAFRYLGWAAIQQLIILRVVADRISGLGWTLPWVSLVAATSFALLHAPNQSLMLLTLVGGLLWTWNWQRHRTLLPNVIAHAVCGLIASAAFDRSWLWSAEIGSRFFAG